MNLLTKLKDLWYGAESQECEALERDDPLDDSLAKWHQQRLDEILDKHQQDSKLEEPERFRRAG